MGACHTISFQHQVTRKPSQRNADQSAQQPKLDSRIYCKFYSVGSKWKSVSIGLWFGWWPHSSHAGMHLLLRL
jgi:hypothetical protein